MITMLNKRKILHGAGQSAGAFLRYCNAVEKFKPCLYMLYVRINEIGKKFPEKLKEMENISDRLIPQIGLNLKAKELGEQCPEIISGKYDKEINLLTSLIKKPAFLRVGYEFNNPDAKYKPNEYIQAWKHIEKLVRKNKHLILVWDCCTAFSKNIKEVMKYYPGDTNVDWFGNNFFGVKHFKDNKNKVTEDFYQESVRHKKPLMICESSAARVGVLNGQKSWDEWFKPYFKWIVEHKNVKAFCYINWNWATDWKQPEWGNCRIEDNEVVRINYVKELSDRRYFHLSDV